MRFSSFLIVEEFSWVGWLCICAVTSYFLQNKVLVQEKQADKIVDEEQF